MSLYLSIDAFLQSCYFQQMAICLSLSLGICDFKVHLNSQVNSVLNMFLYQCIILVLFFSPQSLNGVWVNGTRLPSDEAHPVRLGDSIQLGVPVIGNKAEFDYVVVQKPLRDIKRFLAKKLVERVTSKSAHISKKPKRKLTMEEVEPSTSKPKLYRCSSADKSLAVPCPLSPLKGQQRVSHIKPEGTRPGRDDRQAERPSDGSSATRDFDNLQM